MEMIDIETIIRALNKKDMLNQFLLNYFKHVYEDFAGYC